MKILITAATTKDPTNIKKNELTSFPKAISNTTFIAKKRTNKALNTSELINVKFIPSSKKINLKMLEKHVKNINPKIITAIIGYAKNDIASAVRNTSNTKPP